jgi:hypothetical protein
MTNQAIPFVAGPLVDKAGNITYPWWAFFRSILDRTGGQSGVDSGGLEVLQLLQASAAQKPQALTAQDEGALVSGAVAVLNFTGAGVTATLTGPGLVAVDVPGASGTVTSVDIDSPGGTINVGGGPIITAGTLTVDLPATGVAAGAYGNATNVASFTVDAFGRLTLAGNVPISFPAAVTSITAGTGLTATPNPIVGVGTIAFAAIADQRLLANISGGVAAPTAQTLTAILDDIIGTTQGAIIVRDATVWEILGPGADGQVLTAHGTAADLTWEDPPAAGVSYVPLSMGTEPLTFVSDGLGQPILVPYTP